VQSRRKALRQVGLLGWGRVETDSELMRGNFKALLGMICAYLSRNRS
jgi:hypothetical protein